MSDETERTQAGTFLDEHPELREAMNKSHTFPEMMKRSSLTIDDEELYVVKGDALGDKDELFLDSVIRGSSPESPDSLARALFLEMNEPARALIMERKTKQ